MLSEFFSRCFSVFKFFVVHMMLLIEQRLFCLEVPLGDLGQFKGLLAPKQWLAKANGLTSPTSYFATQSIGLKLISC